jgi:hypothetical protein
MKAAVVSVHLAPGVTVNGLIPAYEDEDEFDSAFTGKKFWFCTVCGRLHYIKKDLCDCGKTQSAYSLNTLLNNGMVVIGGKLIRPNFEKTKKNIK